MLGRRKADTPTIRTIRPTDLVSLIAFLRSGAHREVTAPVWPEVWERSEARILRGLLARWVVRPTGSQVWVCLAGGNVHGLAVARPRASGLLWDVAHLFVAGEDRLAGVELLEHTAAEAARSGARRVFLLTPVDGELARIVSRAGFANYTTESLYSIRLAAAIGSNGLMPARPRLRQDTQALFQLYNAAVPCRVRSAEAMTVDEWSSLDRGKRPWAPSLGGGRRHFVWEGQGGTTGWFRLTFGAKSQHLELLVHPSQRAHTEERLLYALSQTSPRTSVYVSAREYQPELISALEAQGFSRVADYLVFARELAARVPNHMLVPARA